GRGRVRRLRDRRPARPGRRRPLRSSESQIAETGPGAPTAAVIRGLVPRTYRHRGAATDPRLRRLRAWVRGTSPRMTAGRWVVPPSNGRGASMTVLPDVGRRVYGLGRPKSPACGLDRREAFD